MVEPGAREQAGKLGPGVAVSTVPSRYVMAKFLAQAFRIDILITPDV